MKNFYFPPHVRYKFLLTLFIAFSVSIIPHNVFSACNPSMADYIAYPPFLVSKVEPNVLLILDTSGSMNWFAYREVAGIRCDDVSVWTGYNPANEYYGLFKSNKCYRYDNTHHYFYVDGDTVDDPSTPTIIERSTGSDPNVKKFSGNWLNWWTMRRIDIAKKVLTGGRIAADPTDTVLVGTPDNYSHERRIFNDYTTATDPEGILTGAHTKNVYYTPFHQGIYSYFLNDTRLGESTVVFRIQDATFDEVGDLTGDTCFSSSYTDLTQPTNPADIGGNTGESASPGYYFVAVKVETTDLPVQGIAQKMADRVRFGYMHFNYSEGGIVENYVGETSTTTNPHGTTVSELVYNINQQEVAGWTPLTETLWEATRYFQQETPKYSSADFSVNSTWDPYYFNDLSIFVPCAKSYIIYLSDGAATQDTPPTANWPTGANTNDLTGDDSSYYLDDLAFNIHTQDLRSDLESDQTISLYTVFCFDDSNTARCQMMKAARAGGFIDRNGDGDTGGTVSDTDPTAFVGDPEWDKNGDNIPDTYYEAQNGQTMEKKIMRAIADILSRTASGTAASVISNSRGGEGAIYQAVFYTESEAEPLTGDTVNWYGSIHSLFLDSHGNMREDSSRGTDETKYALDDGDKVVEFDGDTAKAKSFDYDPITGTKTGDGVEKDISELNFIWDALSQLSSPTLDVTNQRTYSSNPTPFQRYIFTDYIDTSQPVSTSNVDSSQIMDFLPDFVDDATNDNYYFLNPDLLYDDDGNPSTPDVGLTETEMIEEAKKIIRYIRGEEGLTETGTGFHYRNRTLDTDGDGVGDTVYRLGDIVHSTPTVVSRPAENYDLLYNDSSFLAFKKKYANRRSVVYAGANDGMFHAFNGGFYNKKDKKFMTRPLIWHAATSSWITDTSYTNYSLGAELWAYVPNALLPHLKWLKEPLNKDTHIFYVDLKPRVFDAKIFPVDSNHPYGWGTVLLGGMRFGGAPIGVDTDNDGDCDLTFTSSYFALDITNPEAPPKLLWSFTDNNLGFTTSYPTPIRVGDKWFIVIGSGPVDFEATRKDDGIHFTEYGGSLRTASVYILNAADGSVAQTFSMDSHSFMADPIAADFDLETSGGEYDREWSGEAIYIASDGCGA